ARIAALIRRRRFDGNKVLIINELTIDLQGKSIHSHNKSVDFTRKEYDLLLYLVSNKNRVVSKNAIAEHLSGDNAEAFNNFDFIYTHIKNIKRKLVASGCQDYIRSIYGMGYKFEI
ncbi:MAG: winged helix-turn-helix transcriptional regulator, partial [Chitinophagaceae bacterium]|nr:winged helix-turn-helix transcriptional regulator [Chitinophagaceae bacterium]